MTRQVRIPTTLELQKHAYALARAFGVRLVEDARMKPDDALAIAGAGIAVCAPIVDETTYAVALHELGHLVAPLGSLRGAVSGNRANLTRDEEAAAWEWARRQALLWTDVMERVAAYGEGTYAQTTSGGEAAEPPAPVAPIQQINWDDWK